MEADRFREPTGAEMTDPVLRRLYDLDRDIHRTARHAEHELLEAKHFRESAGRAADEQARLLYSRSADAAEQRATRLRERMTTLKERRKAVARQAAAKGARDD